MFASRVLVSAGYVPIGLDHCALPHDRLAVASRNGTLRRNFQSYTTGSDDALIGLGASAIGALREGYVRNHVPLHAWRAAVRSGGRGAKLAALAEHRDSGLVEIHGSRLRVAARHLVRTVAVVFDSRLAAGGRYSRAV